MKNTHNFEKINICISELLIDLRKVDASKFNTKIYVCLNIENFFFR